MYVEIFVLIPLPDAAIAWTVCTFEQTAMHLPQRMHLLGSLMSDGEVVSNAMRFLVGTNRSVMTPRSAAVFCNSQFRLRMQERHSLGWFASSSSTLVLRASRIRAELVTISIPSRTQAVQERTRDFTPFTSTTHTAHEEFLATSSM